MTVMAVNPQVRARTGATPVKAAGARGAKPSPPPAVPPAPRRRQVPLTPMRQDTAKSLRKLAAHVQGSHPDMSVHAHLRDAARVLESGNEEGAQRHLRAAMFALTPQSLLRNGVRDDAGHLSAREAMHGVHRHLLLVKDIQDVGEKNRAAIARDSYGDLQSAPSLPSSPVRADPNAGYGPGALAQKPAARQPGGDRALNAPARTNSGGSDPAVADPVGPQPKGSKQFGYGWDEVALVIELTAMDAAWDEVCRVIELAVPRQAPARTWDDIASVVELSAKTAALEVTPAPYGKPGGPGLYHVKGLKHSDYLEQIVHALMTKRGMGKGQATAIARGAIRKWSRGGGKVHPEVRAAAAGAEAEELKAQARAHAHAVTWDDIGKVIEMAAAPTWDDLASVIELAAAAAVPGQQIAAGQPAGAAKSQQAQQPSPAKSANATAQLRVGAGSPAGGQFAPAGSGSGGGGSGGGKQPMDAHQQHVAHLQHLATHGTPAQQQAAKALLAKMTARQKTGTAPKATTSKAAAAKAPATAKSTAKASTSKAATSKTASTTTPKTASTTAAKPAGSMKTATARPAASKTTAKAAAGKAASSKTASATAKAAAHKAHLAHVAHLQHLATHGNPAQKKAALAVLARLGVKP